MSEIPRAAVIATHNRLAELMHCVEAIRPQVDVLVVVDNASTPPVHYHDFDEDTGLPSFLIHDPEQPPNLSRLWNVGLARVRRAYEASMIRKWNVAILNDDAIPPPGWFDAVAGAMRDHGADAASSDPFDQMPVGMAARMGAGAPMSVHTRLAGWAMMLRGEWEGARFDERLRWWFGDDELSLRAREAGGLVHVGGFPVPNTGADSSTRGVLAEQAGRDRATFVQITGRQPW